ncbi:MAG: hypothetical protein ACLFPL_02930 [Candidatus Nanoarchaeia archaeon]
MSSQERVGKKAQEILDSFANQMNTTSIESSYTLQRHTSMREEGEGNLASDEFREDFLNNAHKRSNDAIVTKKGEWVKNE